MATTARFLYVQQNPKTLDGPYIIHTRKPAGILEMEKAHGYIHSGHKTASFKWIEVFHDIKGQYPYEGELHRIEKQATQWYFSQVSQKLITA
jgi:hypothetical protein